MRKGEAKKEEQRQGGWDEGAAKSCFRASNPWRRSEPVQSAAKSGKTRDEQIERRTGKKKGLVKRRTTRSAISKCGAAEFPLLFSDKINQYGSRIEEQHQEDTLTGLNHNQKALNQHQSGWCPVQQSSNPQTCKQAPSYLWLLFTLWEYDSGLSAPSNTALRGGRQMRGRRWSSPRGSDTGCCFWLAQRVWRCCCRYCRCCLCCEIHANWIRSCSNERILPARTLLPSPFPPIKSAKPPPRNCTHAQLCNGQGKNQESVAEIEPKGKGGHARILWMHRRWLWYIGQSRDRERERESVSVSGWSSERERESGRGMRRENWRRRARKQEWWEPHMLGLLFAHTLSSHSLDQRQQAHRPECVKQRHAYV